MVFLTPDLHHSLEVEKIELLKRNNISTVVEFLRADSKHLRKILNINGKYLKNFFWNFQ